MKKNREIVTEGGETVVKLYETEVVRITASDIILDSATYQNEETMLCMNEALAPYGFRLSETKDGSWNVSDGKTRLIRFYDGVTIEGAAVLQIPPEKGGKGGPAHTVRAPTRYAPY